MRTAPTGGLLLLILGLILLLPYSEALSHLWSLSKANLKKVYPEVLREIAKPLSGH